MENELYDLKNELKNAKTGHDFINILLDERFKNKNNSTLEMKQNNLMYIVGVVDGLYYSGKITREDYTLFLKYFGL